MTNLDKIKNYINDNFSNGQWFTPENLIQTGLDFSYIHRAIDTLEAGGFIEIDNQYIQPRIRIRK